MSALKGRGFVQCGHFVDEVLQMRTSELLWRAARRIWGEKKGKKYFWLPPRGGGGGGGFKAVRTFSKQMGPIFADVFYGRLLNKATTCKELS